MILQLAGILVGGIVFVIVPLLSLTANNISKIRRAVQEYGLVEVHHLDETPYSELVEHVIPMMETLGSESSTTVFLFSSPQYLADNTVFRAALLHAHRQKILRLVAIDEAHLHTMHGRTFRDCIRIIRDVFFGVVFATGVWHPLFLAMTATMSVSLLADFSKLTHVDWGRRRDSTSAYPVYPHLLWSSSYAFRQRYIKMEFEVTGEIKQLALPRMVRHLKDNSTAFACFFVNFKSECTKYASDLEDLLAMASLSVDVVQIHGDMDKNEKFAFTRLFTGAWRALNYVPRALMATSAANTGIDQELLTFAAHAGLFRCNITAMQERGRVSRKEGMPGFFWVFTNWKMFVKLLLTTLRASIEGNKALCEPSSSINTMISALSPNRQSNQVEQPIGSPLTAEEKKKNLQNAHKDLIDVVRLFFLPNRGCIHCRTEWFMANGVLEDYPCVMEPCGSQCFVCTGDIEKYILPVVFEGAKEFLSSCALTDKTPFLFNFNNTNDLLDLLHNNNDMKLKVFGKVSIKKYNVAAFFFQCLATNLMSIEWESGKVCCVVSRDSNDKCIYNDIKNWEDFTFRTAFTGRGRAIKKVSFLSLCRTYSQLDESLDINIIE